MKYILVILSIISLNAQATCFSNCEADEEGALLTSHCSAPGGPVRTTTKYFKNGCKDELWVEYVCEGSLGASFPKPIETPSEQCSLL